MAAYHSELLSNIMTVLGTAAFAISAVLAAHKKDVDLFTVIILGVITAVGGGTIRDCLLDVPVFWSEDTRYIWVAITASTSGFIFLGLFNKHWLNTLYLHIDAFASAMFAVQATNKAWSLGFGLSIGPVFMGLITAIGGGMIRDILLQRPTLLLQKDLYAIPVGLGCALHSAVLAFAPQYTVLSSILSILFIISGRSLSIYFKVGVPQWALLGNRFTLIKDKS